MSHFSRRCLRVFAFGCLLVRLVVFCSHALSLVIACAVWRSAGKLFPLIFCRYPFSVVVHNVALFTALPESFCIWLLFVRVVVFHPHALSLFISCAVWRSAEKSVQFIFTALFLLVLRCNAFYK